MICGASTFVPIHERTVICELEHGHAEPHHGHINEGLAHGSSHYQGPLSWDWYAERELAPSDPI